MSGVPTERIRNVLVLGHGGTGKSSLVEALLALAGHAAHGPGCPTVDDEPEERERGHSLALAVASVEVEGVRLNLLDAPGGVEAVGDAYPALLAADVALFVVDATVGIQAQHEELWAACEDLGIPRIVFLNKLDLDRARVEEVLADLRERYGKPLAAVQLPFERHGEFVGVVDVLHLHAAELVDGQRVEEDVPEDVLPAALRAREVLVEAVVENDDDLLERYLEGEQPSTEQLADLFDHGIAECGFFPVLLGSATKGIGVGLLLHFLADEAPSPAEAPHPLPHDGPTVAYVAKTFSDQYVGRISVLRLLAGGLDADDELRVERTGEVKRLHQLFRLLGRQQQPVDGVSAGDLVAVAKLEDVRTGDLLVAPSVTAPVDLGFEVPRPPAGNHRVVLAPVSTSDDDKLSTALQRILQEDPAITTTDEVADARVLCFAGPTHVDVTIERLARKFGVQVTAEPAPIDHRSTIRRPAAAVGRHVKQSGGHGQFGIVSIEIRPLPRGSGVQFEDAIVGGVVPGTYIPSVEKGVRAALASGPLGGFPVQDVAVRLVDGKHHSVDSSDAAFQAAGALAVREALAQADLVLLEPVALVRLVVPEELTGAAMSDLSARRARILGTAALGAGRTRIEAHVPEVELTSFTAALRALTGGRGTFDRRYDHHDEVPDHVATRILGDLQPA